MTLAKAHPIFSSASYLEFERDATERHEFLDGKVYATTGDSLTDYIQVVQDRSLIEHFQNQSGAQWEKSEFEKLETIFKINPIECEIALARLNDSIKFSS